MKSNVSKEYIRRLRKILKSKLNGGNLVFQQHLLVRGKVICRL